MRVPIVAGNWKMHTTPAEAVDLVSAMRDGLDAVQGAETIVCPPFVSLVPVAEALRGSSVKVGAQNMYVEPKGAFTGEISPTMLLGLCDYVILGHSERRHYFNEDDAFVNQKVAAALEHGLKPILAVGERLEERESGMTESVITRQVQQGLAGIAASPDLVVAYEPVWAIGTGKAASAQDAGVAVGLIRRLIAQQYDDAFAGQLRILYGGSVNPENFPELMSQPGIDGGLVGGASLDAGSFVDLVRQAAEARRG